MTAMTRSRSQGFSLLELLVASAIFFSFLVGVSVIYAHSHRTYRRGQSRMEVQQNARIATETMLRELRRAGYDPSEAIAELPSSSAVQAAAADAVTFVCDVDGDGVSDEVTYRQRGAEVLREVAAWDGSDFPAPTTDQLADGVSAFTLTYYDGAAALPAPVAVLSLPSIRRIGIRLVTMHQEAGIQESFPIVVDVCLRNQD
jgi:hypothetical protein